MTLAASAIVLLAHNLRSWFGARGFIMVVAAALVPLLLTGSWVATHQKDVAIDGPITWDPAQPIEGVNTTFHATVVNKARFNSGPFNATLSVGSVQGSSLVSDATNTTQIANLAPGERRIIDLTWKPRSGIFVVLADADSSDKLAEIEEYNNQKPGAVEVHAQVPTASQAPAAPKNLTGPSGATKRADLGLGTVSWTPSEIKPNDNATFRVNVVNFGPDPIVDANVTFRVGQVFSGFLYANVQNVQNVSLASGENRTLTLAWNSVPPGVYWVQAYVNVTKAKDPNAANNHVATPFVVHLRVPADFKFPEPPTKLTIKQFYLQILENLHIRILLPLIGLFYAAGVLSDEKDRGNLTYILTRPVPRWQIPITKFVASFVVAAVAVTIGILVTYFLLLGTPQGKDVGFLTTPLLISLVCLFVYGAFFILLGVLVERPYIIGLAWVIGWETIAGNFVPWVKNLTISHHLVSMISGAPDNPAKPATMTDGWRLDNGIQWLPVGHVAVDALRNLLIAAFVFIALASLYMRQREFDV
jgi:ABC-type transport system involved in multi-copper enzyme maturation permease subunit